VSQDVDLVAWQAIGSRNGAEVTNDEI
jgi:hypothetical protein